jgi:hypothetical protein
MFNQDHLLVISKWISMPHHHNSNLMRDVVSTKNRDAAFDPVYQKRIKHSHNSDVWDLSSKWTSTRMVLQEALLAGSYRLSPMQCYQIDGELISLWNSKDAVVIRAIAQILGPLVGEHVGKRCYHLKGRGGVKAAVKSVERPVKRFNFVRRSDVAQFYESMQIPEVIDACKPVVKDWRVLGLIAQLIDRVDVLDAEHTLNLKNGVGSRLLAQHLGPSSIVKIILITNEVTTEIFTILD